MGSIERYKEWAEEKLEEGKKIVDNAKSEEEIKRGLQVILQVIEASLPYWNLFLKYASKSLIPTYKRHVEDVKRFVEEYFASRKQYWDSLREDSVRLIEQLKSQINDIERKIKENEEKRKELPPVAEELLPWLTKLKALKGVLEDLKRQLYTEQGNLITWEVRSIYTETVENIVKILLDKLEKEGETGLASLEAESGMKELLEISSKMTAIEEDEWKIMEEYVKLLKLFGPKVTREEVERLIDEHLATMESKWKESGWSEEGISKETEKARERLWKQWEPFLK